MKLFSPKKLLIIAIILILVSIPLFIFSYSTIQNKQKSTLASIEKWTIENTKRENIEALALYMETIKDKRSELESHFILKSDVVSFLDTLEKIAISANTPLEISTVDVALDGLSLGVSMKSFGDFEDIYKFTLSLSYL